MRRLIAWLTGAARRERRRDREMLDWLTGAPTRNPRKQDREMLAWLRKTHR
jgi:hypothetical protein